MRVTFDSNVWEKVVDRSRAAADPPGFQAALPTIERALRNGDIQGYLAEGYFTIEAMTKSDRAEFLARQGVVPNVVEGVRPDGSSTTMVVAAADESRRPALPDEVVTVLPGAIELGLRILPHPRFHTFALPQDWYETETDAIRRRTLDVSKAIEDKGVGLAKLISYSRHLSWKYQSNQPFVHVPDVPMTGNEAKKVSEHAAEWADGEALACHIGFGKDIFCTQDRAQNSPKPSVMDAAHRSWLASTFGVRFMSVEEFASAICPGR